MSTIQFPKLPKEHYYEDYISAIMVLSKCFLERGIIKVDKSSGKDEVLELDIVATVYSKDCAQKYLVEIKGGKSWGYPELFKIRGWMDYLGIDKARFIVQEIADKPIESIKEEMKTLDIEVIVNDYDKFKEELRNEELCESLGLNGKEISDQTIEMLCYSFLIEDLMCSKLIRSYKESDIDNGKIGYDRLFSY